MENIISKQAILTQISQPNEDTHSALNQKISIVGTGRVGMACVISLLMQKVSNEITLIDKNSDLVIGEMLDLQYASIFLDSPNIYANTELKAVRGSRIVVLAMQHSCVSKLIDIYNEIIPEIASHCPDAILIVATEPVDLFAYLTWKLSGFPPHQVFGTGTALDTARFRFLVAKKLDVSPAITHANIIGQRGESSVPVWSGVSVSGVRLREINSLIGYDNDPEQWVDVHREVLDSEQCVCELKGLTCWGPGLTVAKLVNAIIRNTHECFTISTFVRGCKHGSDRDIFLSLPCILGCQGVAHIVKQQLTETEREKLQDSANKLFELLQEHNVAQCK